MEDSNRKRVSSYLARVAHVIQYPMSIGFAISLVALIFDLALMATYTFLASIVLLFAVVAMLIISTNLDEAKDHEKY